MPLVCFPHALCGQRFPHELSEGVLTLPGEALGLERARVGEEEQEEALRGGLRAEGVEVGGGVRGIAQGHGEGGAGGEVRGEGEGG